MKTLDERFHELAISPMKGKGRPNLHSSLRSFPEGRHVIYYIPEADHIIIVNILHERMDADKHIHIG